jgi:uncharacterized repeat protein (TIGR03803 family)
MKSPVLFLLRNLLTALLAAAAVSAAPKPSASAQVEAAIPSSRAGLSSASTPPSTVTILVNFDGTNGQDPFTENLVQGKDGNLYGTTTYGGSSNDGTIFKMTPGGTLTTIHTFTGVGTDGAIPLCGLALGVDGNFYGTTNQGGTGDYGTVFKITPAGTLTTLHSFDETDGAFPGSALVQGTDKNFYGTTEYGVPGIYGTVFTISPSGTFSSLVSFDDINGYEPIGGMVQGTDGNFYGTTATGGASDLGVVFKMTSAGTLTTLASFDNTDGWEPEGQLIQATNGSFYGTTLRGGANGDGEVFKITASGTLTALHSFDVTDGFEPNDALVQATDGNFYGTTTGGGTGSPSEDGTVFEITPAGTLTTLYNFTGYEGDGASPFGGLVQHTSGALYGVTSGGGTGELGTIFSLNAGLGPFVKLLPASGKVGATIAILGSQLSTASAVSFGTVSANFTKGSNSYLTAVVPAGATTGTVTVTIKSGKLKSNVAFRVP